MKKIALLIAVALCTATTVHAQYKCIIDGKPSFQDTPCRTEATQNTAPKPIKVAPQPKLPPRDEEKMRRESIEATMKNAPEVEKTAPVTSTTENLSFNACVIKTSAMALAVGSTNVKNIVNTNSVSITRFCTKDGSVLVTCSNLDKKMVITNSPQPC